VLTNFLYEWETRQTGWRDRGGKDQQMVNRGMDILSHLHRKFVVERYFKIGGRYGKDPRPLMNEIVRNKEQDWEEKREREVLLDHEAVLKIPDRVGSTEDIVIASRALDDLEKELLTSRCYRGEEERALFRTVYVDDSPIDEARECLGIPSNNDVYQ